MRALAWDIAFNILTKTTKEDAKMPLGWVLEAWKK